MYPYMINIFYVYNRRNSVLMREHGPVYRELSPHGVVVEVVSVCAVLQEVRTRVLT